MTRFTDSDDERSPVIANRKSSTVDAEADGGPKSVIQVVIPSVLPGTPASPNVERVRSGSLPSSPPIPSPPRSSPSLPLDSIQEAATTKSSALRLLYRCKRFEAGLKTSIHVHFIERIDENLVEAVVFNSANITEAPHLFVSKDSVPPKALEFDPKAIGAVIAEHMRQRLTLPKPDQVRQAITDFKLAQFLLGGLVVQPRPPFTADIVERPPPSLPSQPSQERGRRASAHSKPSTEQPAKSLCLPEADPASPAVPAPVNIQRYGKSSDQLGELPSHPISPSTESLMKITESVLMQGASANRTAPPPGNKKGGKRGLVPSSVHFARVASNAALLRRIFAFLHLSDRAMLQAVSKPWKALIGNELNSARTLHLSSRTSHLLSRSSAPLSAFSFADRREGEVVATYVSPETIRLFLSKVRDTLEELTLHYVVLDVSLLGFMSQWAGRLRVLSLGVIKIDDTVRSEGPSQALGLFPAPPKGISQERGLRPQRPDLPSPSSRKSPAVAMTMGGRRATVPNSQNQPPSSAVRMSPTPLDLAGRSPSPVAPAATTITSPPPPLRFMNAQDIKAVLYVCGAQLEHLELSVSLGALTSELFHFAPNLKRFSMRDVGMTDTASITCSVLPTYTSSSLQDLLRTVDKILVADLLVALRQGQLGACLLTNQRGRVVIATEGWISLFGYSMDEIEGRQIEMLRGALTDRSEFHCVLHGLTNQVQPEECTTFLYDKRGRAMLCHVSMLPNVTKHDGAPLTRDCLSTEVLGQLAAQQEDWLLRGRLSTHRRRDRPSGRQTCYHLIHFVHLSEPFASPRPGEPLPALCTT